MPKDAINVNNMNVSYSRKKEIFHETKIVQSQRFLGPFQCNHPAQVKVGDIQSFVFKETVAGPFYLTEEERIQKRTTKIVGKRTTKKNKARLKVDFRRK